MIYRRIQLVGHQSETLAKAIKSAGFELVKAQPDLIISHGGDGTLLAAERQFPTIPKLPIRHRSDRPNSQSVCPEHTAIATLATLKSGQLNLSHCSKLTANVNGQVHWALNEFSLHHVQPNQAIRFTVKINQEGRVQRAIGDGVIVATPFGSHAYYRSITSSTFRIGIGIAFNNTIEPIDHLVVEPNALITLTLNRGRAYCLTDNDPELTIIPEGGQLAISQAKPVATLLGLDYFRCPDCGRPAAPTVVY